MRSNVLILLDRIACFPHWHVWERMIMWVCVKNREGDRVVVDCRLPPWIGSFISTTYGLLKQPQTVPCCSDNEQTGAIECQCPRGNRGNVPGGAMAALPLLPLSDRSRVGERGSVTLRSCLFVLWSAHWVRGGLADSWVSPTGGPHANNADWAVLKSKTAFDLRELN